MTNECDVVVVGGGLAGMTAAVRSAELGRRVIVLEKGEADRYPCNSRYSGGIFHIAFNDVAKPPAELYAVIKSVADPRHSDGVARAVADHAGRLVQWLQSQGARFMRFSPVDWHRWCLAPPRALAPGLDWDGRGPDVTLRRLADALHARGGRLVRGARAVALQMKGDVCCGIVAQHAGREEFFACHAVILADGGFQADREFFTRFIGPDFDAMFQRGAATGCGDGLRMAQEAGAALTYRESFYGHLLSRDSFTNPKVWPYPELDALAVSGLLVGPDGRRIGDEGCGGIALANVLARSGQPSSAVIVTDTPIWEGPGRSARIPANPFVEKAGGTIHRGTTIEALAQTAGLPAAALSETVAAYNAALDRGTLSALTPPRSTDRHPAMPIRTPPFLAIPIVAGITYTMGGIAIDGEARVLREDGRAIPGLYAAGATTGGLEGGPKGGYVGGLVKAGVLGLRAAESAAATGG